MAKASPSKSGGRSNWYQQAGRLAEHATAKFPGSKEIPEGDPNCFAGKTFVITGQLESLERETAKNLIERYGGRVTTAVSSKTTYLLLGDDPGQSKLTGAEKHNTTQINEDDLLKMIADSKKNPPKAEPKSPKSTKTGINSTRATPTKPGTSNTTVPQKRKKAIDSDDDVEEVTVVRKPATGSPTHAGSRSGTTQLSKRAAVVTLESDDEDMPLAKSKVKLEPSSKSFANGTKASESSRRPATLNSDVDSSLWVDKYAPREVKQIAGQETPASPANKLRQWLLNWQKNFRLGIKPNPFASRDGAGFRSALISGPPGIGKTTTALLVCKELGLNYVHLNASDSRSKKLLDQQLAGALGNLTILDYGWNANKARQAQQDRSKTAPQSHAVMIFDEVDGVAGNEDRGGIAELIQLIKQTKYPIVCICNDRSHMKVRSLANYCFDIRVNRLQVDKILPLLQRIRDSERVRDLPDDVLRQIIIASHNDIRQSINTMSLMAATDDPALAGSGTQQRKKTKADDVGVLKDSIKKSPFDAAREVFQAVPAKYPGYAIKVKNDLFFQDYNFMPLFVQDNYLRAAVREKHGSMQRFSDAADAISYGDTISRVIRGSQQAWSLLPLLSAFSCVIPGEICNTNLTQQIQFPQWLGKNSTTNKNTRSLQDLLWHMKLRVSCSLPGLVCEYVPLLARKLLQPLQTAGSEGVAEVIETLNEYDLIREDMLNLVELNTFEDNVSSNYNDKASERKTPFDLLEPKVKAALTRGFNKEGKPLPYSLEGPVKKKRGGAGGGAGGIDEALGEILVAEDEAEAKEQRAAIEADDEDDDEKDDVAKDPNIEATTSKANAAGGRSSRGGAKSAAASGSRSGGGRGAAASSSRGARGSGGETQRSRGSSSSAASSFARGGAARGGSNRGRK